MKTQVVSLTDSPSVTLTCYLLDQSSELQNAAERPAVLICPGGYAVCSDREAEPIAMAYLAEGYHAFVLRYSLGEHANFPQPLRDAEAALRYIRAHAQEWGVCPQQIAACGFSAGGHLAAALGTMGAVRPNALILGYPCITEDMGEMMHVQIPSCDQYVDANTPPVFLFSTRTDELVPIRNSLTFANALDAAGVPFELHIFGEGCHGLSLAKGFTSSGLKRMVNGNVAQWFAWSVQWLQRLFSPFPSEQAYLLLPHTEQYSTALPLGALWENEACRNLVAQAFPMFASGQDLRAAMTVSLEAMQSYAPEIFTTQKLETLNQQLQKIAFVQSGSAKGEPSCR